MELRFLLTWIFLYLNAPRIFTYKIPNVKLDILEQGFRVSIPDEPGITKVLYVMEINEMCPAIMDYVVGSKENLWSTEQPQYKLQSGDEITISLMVENNENVYIGNECIKIRANNSASSNTSKDGSTNLLAKCHSETINMCQTTPTKTRSAAALCKDDLIFNENFKLTSTLDKSRWTHDVRLGVNDLDTEFMVFDDSTDNCFIESGALNIKPTITKGNIREGFIDLGDRCTPIFDASTECNFVANRLNGAFGVRPPIQSTLIHTKESFTFQFGRVEVKAKLPKGDWIFPYIMLVPVQHSIKMYNPQIRIAFAHGNSQLVTSTNEDIGGSHLYGGTIFARDVLNRTMNMKGIKRTKHFGDDFHTYSLTWAEDRIIVAVDGQIYGEITEGLENFGNEVYIALGVSAGGHLEFSDNLKTSKPWENTSPKAALNFWKSRDQWSETWDTDSALKVEYIRVYAL